MLAKKRFRPLWVVLHWLMAVLVFATFGIGLLSLAYKPNNAEKLVPLAVHMLLGITILLIVIARYMLRLLVFQPARRAAQAGTSLRKKQALLDQLSIYVHPLLYIFTALMALLGIAIAIPADLFSTIFFKTGSALPTDFYVYSARTWHGSFSLILMLLIAQHVLVAVFHQFLKGENFLRRMWFINSASKSANQSESPKEQGENHS